MVGGAEFLWRWRGMSPTVTDSQDLWAAERSRLDQGETRDMVVLLGASRIQLGFSHPAFREVFPDQPLVNLAIDGSCPAAALADMAEHSGFRGVVIAEFDSSCLEPAMRSDQEEWVAHYRRGLQLDARLNTEIGAQVQGRAVVTSGALNLLDLAKTLMWGGGLPRPNYLVTFPDRAREADYTKMDVAEHRRWRIERLRASTSGAPLGETEWLAAAKEVERAIERIQSRGGRVALVRFPTADEHWELDEARYPRARYWDRWAAESQATMLHFRDVPAMVRLPLPDTSHFDRRDAPAFTRALLDELERRGLFSADPR